MSQPRSPELTWRPTADAIRRAARRLEGVAVRTPLDRDRNLSEEYEANVLLKREDLQVVRSYKIRGAYNKIRSCSDEELSQGVSCASAGNHAQGVALAAKTLQIHATIYMPLTTPRQKVERVRALGGTWVDIELVGDVFDETEEVAVARARADGSVYVHPFEDPVVIEGQGTVGLEIVEDAPGPIDIVFLPVGGGGLASGVGSCVKALSPRTEIIGVVPEGAPSMLEAFRAGHPVKLDNIDSFADGAAVQQVGNLTFEICREVLDDVTAVPEGRVCTTILKLYNDSGMIVEPAGALAISALEDFRDRIRGRTVVCCVSGGNSDFRRIEEIRERALIYEGKKHYFIVRFPQRAGALRQFVVDVLGPSDDIVHFAYSKKTDRERGPAVVGVELTDRADLEPLIRRMKDLGFFGEYLNERPDILRYLV